MHFIFRIILRRKILRYTLGAQSTPKEVFMEISNYMDFQFLIRFLEGLQKFLGDNCEIIVHDYRKGYDHTIVYAFNSQLSGRDVGGSPRGGMITQLGNDIEPLKHSIISLDTSQKDRLFKSCTTLIEDEHHKIIGSVCLNMDVRDLYLAQSALQNLIGRPGTIGVSAAVGAQIDGMSGCTPSGMASDGTFSGTGSTDGTNGTNQTSMSDRDFILKKNVDDILQHYIYQAESMIGKPMMLMNKEEKIRALDYLDQKGVFKITKTSLLLCDAMQISKYTLYNYLEEARISRKSETNE